MLGLLAHEPGGASASRSYVVLGSRTGCWSKCWAHSVNRDDRGITMRRFVDRHTARHLIDMRAMFCLDRSMRAML